MYADFAKADVSFIVVDCITTFLASSLPENSQNKIKFGSVSCHLTRSSLGELHIPQ